MVLICSHFSCDFISWTQFNRGLSCYSTLKVHRSLHFEEREMQVKFRGRSAYSIAAFQKYWVRVRSTKDTQRLLLLGNLVFKFVTSVWQLLMGTASSWVRTFRVFDLVLVISFQMQFGRWIKNFKSTPIHLQLYIPQFQMVFLCSEPSDSRGLSMKYISLLLFLLHAQTITSTRYRNQ